jgi:ribosome-binding factor A
VGCKKSVFARASSLSDELCAETDCAKQPINRKTNPSLQVTNLRMIPPRNNGATRPILRRRTLQGSAILIGLLETTSGGAYMPEHRARKHHQDRVAETLREEIGAMIEGELSDPRIAFCYVTEVVLNPGGKSARVYVAVDNAVPDIAKAEVDTVAGLEAAKGYIRFELKERMGVRHVPELSFLADRSGRFQARIVELMDRSRKRQKAPVE